jgi:YfiH family protein
VVATDDPLRGVAVRVADCAPILIGDRHGRAVAAVHAGWRGTAARAAQAGVEALRARAAIEPSDLNVAIGPSIRACCYEVGPELREAFSAAGHDDAAIGRWFTRGKGDRWQLDVPRANRDQLEAAGVPAAQIFDSGLCTACHPDVFHSYRRTGRATGRMIGVIRVLRTDSAASGISAGT